MIKNSGVHMKIKEQMEETLIHHFAPEEIYLEDQSDRHIGHAGHDGLGESHFHLSMVSSKFEGKSRLERQRMVYDCLSDFLQGRVHALSMTLDVSKE